VSDSVGLSVRPRNLAVGPATKVAEGDDFLCFRFARPRTARRSRALRMEKNAGNRAEHAPICTFESCLLVPRSPTLPSNCRIPLSPWAIRKGGSRQRKCCLGERGMVDGHVAPSAARTRPKIAQNSARPSIRGRAETGLGRRAHWRPRVDRLSYFGTGNVQCAKHCPKMASDNIEPHLCGSLITILHALN